MIRLKDCRKSRTFETREAAEAWAFQEEALVRRARSPHANLTHVAKRFGELEGFPGREAILSAAAQPIGSGVYFLIDGSEVVYVGQSGQVLRRLADHVQHNGYGRNFDRYAVLPCPADLCTSVESYYIETLTPRFNVAGIPADA